MVLCEPVSAATIKINDSSAYSTSSISLNQQIQDIINSARKGDTLEFLGKYYENLSLVINKPLNIISRAQTTISSNSKNPIFLITSSTSSGTNITGFNLQANKTDAIVIQNTGKITISKNNLKQVNGTGIKVTGSSNININNNLVNNSRTGLSITNSKNVAVTGNKIKNSVNNGVNIGKSQNVTINKNQISSNGNDGISADYSKTVTVEENSISNNRNAVTLKNTSKTQISKNNIKENQGNGIYLDEKVDDTQIKSNNITSNQGIAINLDKSGSNTYINSNIIKRNRIGIHINDHTDNLVITQNLITESVHTGGDDISGIGINFGANYWSSTTFDVKNNAIFGNQKRDAEIKDTDEPVVFGANWYGHSEWYGVNLCPKLKTQLIKSYVTQSGNGIYAITLYTDYDKKLIADQIPSFDAYVFLSDNTVLKVTVKNGKAIIKINPSLTVTKVITSKQIHFPKDIIFKPDTKDDDNNDDQNNTPGGSGNEPGTGGSGGAGGGSGGSGNSAGGTTSGSSSPSNVGAMAVSAAQGSTDSSPGESGSLGGSKGAQELFIDETVKSPQVWSIVGMCLLLLLVILAYYRSDITSMIKKSK